MLWRSPLRGDCTAVLGPGSRRRTRYVRFALYAQTTAASQFTKRAARAAPGPALLVATEIAPAGYPLPRVAPLSFAWKENESLGGSAKARAGSRRRASAQPRSAGLVARARSALRELTGRSMFERSERSERSEFCDRATSPMQCARTCNRPCGLLLAWRTPWRLQAPGLAGNPRVARASSEAPPAARPRLCSRRSSNASSHGPSRTTARGRQATTERLPS